MPQNPDGVEEPQAPVGTSGPSSVSHPDPSNAEPPPGEPGLTSSEISEALAPARFRWRHGGGTEGEEPAESYGNGGGDAPSSGGSGGGGEGGDDGGHGGEEDAEPHEMARMSFFDHLEELRKRLFYSLVAIAVGMAVCWGFADNIYAGLARPITTILREMKLPDKLIYTNPTGPFNLYVKLAMIAGLFLSSPFLIYQAWKFISPGLYKNEKKYALPFILFCSLLFLSGGAFAYFVAFPAALRFLLSFGSQFLPYITVDEYFSLASTIILGLAIVFELPVLILFLTLLRIVTPRFLLRNFRYAFLIIVIIAAAVTPTSDIVNMMIFAAPLLALYFLGIGLSFLVLKARGSKKGT